MALIPGRHNRTRSAEIRDTADGLEYLIYVDTWIPAVYHNDIRHRLIHEAAQHGAYQFQWGRGIDKGLERFLLEHFKQLKTENSVETFHDLSKKEQGIVHGYGEDILGSPNTEWVEQGPIEQDSSPACRSEDKTWSDDIQAAIIPEKSKKNDWRFKVATSDAEACELRRALEPTVQDFQFWLNGHSAPHTADTRSYASRWHYIRVKFVQLWVLQGTQREVPTLRSLDWGGAASILDWRKGAGVDVHILPDDDGDELMDSHSSADEEVQENTDNGEKGEQEHEQPMELSLPVAWEGGEGGEQGGVIIEEGSASW